MDRLDERLARELERAARPADPSGVYQALIRRRARRRVLRKAQGVALAVVVIAGTTGGLWGLSRAFRGVGAARPAASPTGPASSPEGGDVLTITCARDGARVSAATVALGSRGVRIRVENPGGQALVYLRDPERIGRSVGFELDGAPTELVFALPPGEWLVGCFPQPFDSRDHPASDYPARIEVVDPQGFWPSIQDAMGCGEPLPPPAPSAGQDTALGGPVSGRVLLVLWAGDVDRGDLVEVDLSTGEVWPLAVGPGDVYEGRWSPDGSRIALVQVPQGETDTEVFVMGADGGGLTRLTDNGATDDLVRWSPDGRRLSFRSNRGGNLTLYAMNADGSDQHRLLDIDTADRHAWSPDGSRIAFVGSDGVDDGDGCHGEDLELYVVGADGSGLVRLTDDEWYEQSPAWSPDGSTIAFTASDQSDYRWDVFVIDADGSGLRRLTDHPGYDAEPVWSPDGTMLAFTSDRGTGGSSDETQAGTPYVMNADGSGVRPLVDVAALGLDAAHRVWVSDWRA